MLTFVPGKYISCGNLITFFRFKKTAAESYRLLVETFGELIRFGSTLKREIISVIG